MGAQTITEPTICNLLEEKQKVIASNADKDFLDSMYMIGNGYCDFEYVDAKIIVGIIKANNCELNNLIKRKLNDNG